MKSSILIIYFIIFVIGSDDDQYLVEGEMPCFKHRDCIARIGFYGGCYSKHCIRKDSNIMKNKICTGIWHCHLTNGKRGKCDLQTERCQFDE